MEEAEQFFNFIFLLLLVAVILTLIGLDRRSKAKDDQRGKENSQQIIEPQRPRSATIGSKIMDEVIRHLTPSRLQVETTQEEMARPACKTPSYHRYPPKPNPKPTATGPQPDCRSSSPYHRPPYRPATPRSAGPGEAHPIVYAEVTGYQDVLSERRFTLYVVTFQNSTGEKWTIYRRYSAFLNNYRKIKHKLPVLAENKYSFPDKALFRSHVDWIKQKRMESFQQYLQLIISLEDVPEEFYQFIKPTKDDMTGRPTPLSQRNPSRHVSLEAEQMHAPDKRNNRPPRSRSESRHSPHGGSRRQSRRTSLFNITGQLKPIEADFGFGEGKHLGFGKNAVVKRCQRRNAPGEVAIKAVSKSQIVSAQSVLLEIEILRRLDHPQVLKMETVYEDNVHVYMVTELCTGGELYDYTKRRHSNGNGGISEADARTIIWQVLKGVQYLHDDLHIVHRDLKPENLLLKDERADIQIQVIDFGLATYIPENGFLEELVGTPYYVAPEVLNQRYTHACDIWSIGVVMYSLISGHVPFSGKTTDDIFKSIRRGQVAFRGPAWKGVSSAAKDFLWAVFTLDEKKRLTAAQALEHKWLHSSPESN